MSKGTISLDDISPGELRRIAAETAWHQDLYTLYRTRCIDRNNNDERVTRYYRYLPGEVPLFGEACFLDTKEACEAERARLMDQQTTPLEKA